MNNEKTAKAQQEKVTKHLQQNPESKNRETLISMYSFFATHSSMDSVYARCAQTIVTDRIKKDTAKSEADLPPQP